MVRVTLQYISRKGSQNAPKHGKDLKEHARRLTHLYLNDQYIDSIGDISVCQNLKVLFLQNNQLLKIEGLDFASQLTHLYLQRNKLNKIEGFERLVSLQKLYLGNNSISVVEGLENQSCLQELHIEHQSLCPGEEIIFDPRSIAALGSLQVLNIQGNNITSLEDLVGLEKMRTLLVASNNLSDITKIQAVLSAIPSLIELDMRDNPVVQDYKNCNRILASSHNLRVLNEKQISMRTLDFMKKFEEHEQRVKARQPIQAPADLINSISELASNLPEALAKDVTSSIFMGTALRNVKENIGNGHQNSSASEMALSTPFEGGPFFHFPAFKSSTCLQYDGHTIPKPFHRQLILGTQLGHRQQPPRKLKPTTMPKCDKLSSAVIVANSDITQNLKGALKQTICGDMVSTK
ncbi:protein phosphatase 1 regulatory subunit 42-like isoform X2 [Thrips palmi]|uniref:Protein phosphatase 1 regulatory subunit 42-like isoform X2 n=1 Tax=Thrips palmi TaxID=161013 RepID=A0A6P8ZP02_THRPL|nr:protein phosphatase 1 regulatory subunit 42-like isoform X2 [Thrips palmi]